MLNERFYKIAMSLGFMCEEFNKWKYNLLFQLFVSISAKPYCKMYIFFYKIDNFYSRRNFSLMNLKKLPIQRMTYLSPFNFFFISKKSQFSVLTLAGVFDSNSDWFKYVFSANQLNIKFQV